MIRFFKAALLFARHQVWVDQPEWRKADAEQLGRFLLTPVGQRLAALLRNTVIRQQASAMSKASGLKYSAGFATGQAALVAAIEALADPEKTTEAGDQESPDPLTSEWGQ